MFEDVKKMQNRAVYLYPALNDKDRDTAFQFAWECGQFCRDLLEVING